MTLEEQGLLINLWALQWEHEGTLPADPAALRSLARIDPDHWNRCWPRVMIHFKVAGDRCSSEALSDLWRERQERVRKNSEASHRRWGKLEAKRSAPSARIKDPDSEIEPEVIVQEAYEDWKRMTTTQEDQSLRRNA